MDNFHRLALKFSSDPPFDDIGAISELKRAAQIEFENSPELFDTVCSIDAKCFFFELAHSPISHGTHQKCTGSIFCRLQSGSSGLSSLVSRLASKSAKFCFGSHLLALIDHSVVARVASGARFSLSVEFLVLNMEEKISISLVGHNERQVTLSSFPQNIAWFIDRQKIGVPFGRSENMRNCRMRKACYTEGIKPHKDQRRKIVG